MLADGLFVSMNGCDHTGTTFQSMRRKTRMAFTVSGHVFLSNEEELVLPDEISAHQAYVEIVGLPEWFASALSHPYPSIPYTTGIPLTRNARVEAECDDSDFEMSLDDGFKLHIHNTLYWGSNSLFDLNVRQATVAQIRAAGLVTADCMLEKVRPLTAECTRTKLRFQGLDGRDVVGRFDGGEITSDAGGVLLREVEQRTRILGRLSECFTDYRDSDRVEHRWRR